MTTGSLTVDELIAEIDALYAKATKGPFDNSCDPSSNDELCTALVNAWPQLRALSTREAALEEALRKIARMAHDFDQGGHYRDIRFQEIERIANDGLSLSGAALEVSTPILDPSVYDETDQHIVAGIAVVKTAT